MQTIQVKLGNRSYDIVIGQGLLAQAGDYLNGLKIGHKIVIISNPEIAELYLNPIQQSIEKHRYIVGSGFFATPVPYQVNHILIPEGESYKTLETVASIHQQISCLGLDRNSTLIALGGGVVGDITGFVAATYMRGINFVQIPTTLLAQVDSSVGGKTGVNLVTGKNLVGCFYQPKLVLNDTNTLVTLPELEVQTGLAEVIKYGMIRSRELFEKLEQSTEVSEDIIAQCCQIKADIVSADEKEASLRMILNLGHTVGHALEAVTNYTEYTHGQAVALGMIAAGKIALELKMFSDSEQARLISLISKAGLPTVFPSVNLDTLITAMYHDKKVSDEALTFILPKSIGDVGVFLSINPSLVRKIMEA